MINNIIKISTDFLARLPGLPVLLAVLLIVLNFVVRLLPGWPIVEWLARTDLLFHLGAVVGFLGILLGDAL